MLNRLLLRFYEHMALNAFIVADMAKAERYFEKALKVAPQKTRLFYNLGLVKIGLGKFAEAEELMARYRTAEGDSPALQRTMADLYYLSGQRTKAGELYSRCLKRGKEKVLLALRRDICASEQSFGDAMRAAQVYDEGNRLFKESPEEAFRRFEEAVRLDPSHYPSLNNLGALCMNSRQDYRLAKGYFEKSLALSEQPLARKNLDRLAGQSEPI